MRGRRLMGTACRHHRTETLYRGRISTRGMSHLRNTGTPVEHSQCEPCQSHRRAVLRSGRNVVGARLGRYRRAPTTGLPRRPPHSLSSPPAQWRGRTHARYPGTTEFGQIPTTPTTTHPALHPMSSLPTYESSRAPTIRSRLTESVPRPLRGGTSVRDWTMRDVPVAPQTSRRAHPTAARRGSPAEPSAVSL
jgi:hypothetical protein